MATTTPNFGWSVPTSTDLVKNGATAIETLGDSIDASMADLRGGTTGQVLAKQTGTDMDFTWTTPSAGSTIVAGKNKCINGDFGVWQRGTSVNTTTYGYTADRWLGYQYGSVTVSRQTTSDTTNLPFIQYCGRVQRPSGQTGLNPIYLSQSLESAASIPLAGKSVTLSFYARKGSNYSSASSILTAQIISGTGTDQNVNVGGFTGSAQVSAPNVTLTTTWQRFTTTGTVGSTSTQLGLVFTYTPVGTASTNDYFEITGVQLEAASTASDFASASGGSPQAELAMCQRYYYRRSANATNNYAVLSDWGVGTSSTNAVVPVFSPSTMRVSPTAVDYGGSFRLHDGTNGSSGAVTFTITTIYNNPNNTYLNCTAGSGVTQYRPTQVQASNDATAYIGLSAEL